MKNKTFRNGPSYNLNACVGENSGTDNRYGYALGFGDAVKVMLSAAMQEQYTDGLTGAVKGTYMDALIYPICFCARHHIELFLKREIVNVSEIRGKSRAAPMNHNLTNLWLEFVDVCDTADRRLAERTTPIGEHILDYASVDPTGETFRYAQNRKNQEHLTEMGGVINLEVLSKRFERLSEMIQEFEITSEYVVNEYRTGTYTSKLSREELFELARRLPPRSQWADSPDFDNARNAFRSKYQLSSNDFQRAVRKIEAHPQLSSIIGKELDVADVRVDLVDRLHGIQLQSVPPSSLSMDEWAAVDAIYQVGRTYEYPEYYFFHKQQAKLAIEDGRLDQAHLLRQVLYPNRRFGAGLRKLGQNLLFERFEILFPNQEENAQ